MSTRGHLTAAERFELALQEDMAERGRRLSAFKAATADSKWFYDEDTGEWTLEPVVNMDAAA